MGILAAQDLAFAYNGTPVLDGVSFAVGTGELVCLLGPNGCGKTTLLKLLLGLLPPTAGQALVRGRPAHATPPRELAAAVAYVPQAHQPAFAYSVLEAVLMGRAARSFFFGPPTARDRDIALEALDRFAIAHLAHTPVTQLSGGQRQLTLLARALAQGAKALVLDEPITGLDFGHQARFLEILRGLCREGYTCVMTTHFPDHALWVADRVLLLRDGRIEADGPPAAVVTGEALGRLYGLAVSVFPIAAALRVCVPDRISRLCREAPGRP
ncbi:MAG: ABC transporter ATP-binding protein [Solidesulfovibrio sp. DCME]|uniref:ABC transporter ATP-binding protein n=1 Tax=Solidesulfovibrio sp. DCME TaxID=3447380 RepID=UPI003D0B05F7